MPPSDRNIRLVAALLVVGGLAAGAVALLADELGIGASPGTFGARRAALLVAGVLAAAAGALLLARHLIAPKLVGSQWIEAHASPPATRRWLMVAAIALVLGVPGGVVAVSLTDRLIGDREAGEAPPEATEPAPPGPPSAQDRFRAAVGAACERHQGRLHEIAKRAYASRAADRPRLLRANAAAMSAVAGDLERLDPPREDAAAHAQLVEAMREIARAYRAAADAVLAGDEASERSSIDQARAVADLADTLAGPELGSPACGY